MPNKSLEEWLELNRIQLEPRERMTFMFGWQAAYDYWVEKLLKLKNCDICHDTLSEIQLCESCYNGAIQKEQKMKIEIDFDYLPAERGSRENGIQMEPDYPEDVEINSVTYNGMDISSHFDLNRLSTEILNYKNESGN